MKEVQNWCVMCSTKFERDEWRHKIEGKFGSEMQGQKRDEMIMNIIFKITLY